MAKDWKGAPEGFSAAGAAQALGALVVANALAAVAWSATVRHRTKAAVDWRSHLYIHTTSQLGRYIPGKIGLPAVRIAGLGELGVNAKTVTVSIGLELLSWMATAALLGLSGVALRSAEMVSGPWLVKAAWLRPGAAVGAGLALLTLLALIAVPTRRLPARLRWLDGGSGRPLLPASVPLLHMGLWLGWLLHGQRLMASVGLEGTASWLAATGFVLAPVAGFLAFFAPAGAGVREAFLIAWVSPLATTTDAVAVGLLSRGVSLAADASLWLLAWALRARRG